MSRLIKNVRNRNVVEFDTGAFDQWCVYLSRPGQLRYAPKDTEYFAKLYELGKHHGHQKIYDDFVDFYIPTDGKINDQVLSRISTIADTYGVDAEEIEIWFTVIYAGMIAEENKAFAKLKKRIKRLGMHQVLIEGLNPNIAANFSRGKKWRDLDVIMKERNF